MSGKERKAAAAKKKNSRYKMPASIPAGEVICNKITNNKWRIGPSIGVGGFGEIYAACNHDSSPKNDSEYPFVVKIEPSENGPLFVEMHFYLKNAKKSDVTKFMKERKLSTFGMPIHYDNGIHTFKGEKYRYLVLERYGQDLWSLFLSSERWFPTATVFQIGLQMLDVLEYVHSRGYAHADIKGANILLGSRKGTANQVYLVDYGLASRVNDKEFKPDPKFAHNGTIEYTSRDAHLGVSTKRGDLEILGYNMLQWIVGELPWEKVRSKPKTVQEMKEALLKNVRAEITKKYNVPEQLIKYFEYINSLNPKDQIDYTKCRQMFESYLKMRGKSKTSVLEFVLSKKRTATNVADSSDGSGSEIKVDSKSKKNAVHQSGDVIPKKRSKNVENTEPDTSASLIKKKKETVKIIEMPPKATPSNKNMHEGMATQTSEEKLKNETYQVSFDFPSCSCAMVDEDKVKSGDDSSVCKDKKVESKRRFRSVEVVTVKRMVSQKVTTVELKRKS